VRRTVLKSFVSSALEYNFSPAFCSSNLLVCPQELRLHLAVFSLSSQPDFSAEGELPGPSAIVLALARPVPSNFPDLKSPREFADALRVCFIKVRHRNGKLIG
jgi:hypothetical protein